jgi:O-antigen/teichoic acid export membrane protein
MGLVIRQSLKASISNYLGLVIGYINILILMPKVFSPAQVGISRFIIDISSVLAGFATLGLVYSMSRFFPKFNQKDNAYHHGFTFWVYLIPLIGLSLLMILLAISGPSIINLLKDGGSNTSAYIHIIIPLTVIMLFTLITEQYCALLGRIVVVNVIRENGLRFINLILIILAWYSVINFNQFILWLLLSYSMVLVVDLLYLFSINPLNFKPDFAFINAHKSIKMDFFKFTGITLLGSLGPLIITRSDYFSVSMEGGDNLLGIYSTALSIAIMTELPKRVILPILQPIIAKLIHDKKWDELKEVVGKGNMNQVLIGMFILLALWFNADSIFELMPNGQAYNSGKTVILILGIGKLIELFSILPGIVINNSHFYRWNLAVTLACMMAIFITYYWAVPLWSINGTALGIAIGYFTFAIFNIILVYKYYKLHWMTFDWIKVLILFILMLLANQFIPHFGNLWLNIGLRSTTLLMVFAFMVYYLKLSLDLNNTFIQLIKGKFRWF